MVSAGFSPRQLMFPKLCCNSQKARMYWIVTVYIARLSFTLTEPPQHPNQSIKNLQQFTALLLCACACLCVVCECGICSCVCASLCACVNTCRGYGKTLPNDLLPYCLQTEFPTERGWNQAVSQQILLILQCLPLPHNTRLQMHEQPPLDFYTNACL